METFYKVLDADGKPFHGGTGRWHLPKGKRPGKWMPTIAAVEPCASGYHLCRLKDLPQWFGPVVWIAEGAGEMVACDDKVVFARARLLHATGWNETTARLFACDCAWHVLHHYEKFAPTDKRVRKCIQVARRFAHGKATSDELAAAGDAAGAAAWDAAWAAAWAAAGAAAWDAAWAAARAAAWAAARAAARAAAGAAAWDAAWDAEREWQLRRLRKYLDLKGV